MTPPCCIYQLLLCDDGFRSFTPPVWCPDTTLGGADHSLEFASALLFGLHFVTGKNKLFFGNFNFLSCFFMSQIFGALSSLSLSLSLAPPSLSRPLSLSSRLPLSRVPQNSSQSICGFSSLGAAASRFPPGEKEKRQQPTGVKRSAAPQRVTCDDSHVIKLRGQRGRGQRQGAGVGWCRRAAAGPGPGGSSHSEETPPPWPSSLPSHGG